MLAQLIQTRIYARAAARDSSIAHAAGGCGAVHVVACAAPEPTLDHIRNASTIRDKAGRPASD